MKLPSGSSETVVMYTPGGIPVYRKRLNGATSTYAESSTRLAFTLATLSNVAKALSVYGHISYVLNSETYDVPFGSTAMKNTSEILYTSFAQTINSTHTMSLLSHVDTSWKSIISRIDFDVWVDYIKV